MSALTDFGENKLIDFLFRAASLSKPTTWYVALFTTATSDAGGGTEVTGGSYARVQRDPADGNWNATQGGISGNSSGTGGLTDNVAALTFPAPTANWGVITHFALFDASTSGNMWLHGALTTPKTVNNGDPAPSFPAGTLDITIA